MSKLLVLYYSPYGPVETRAGAVAEGAAAVPGTSSQFVPRPALDELVCTCNRQPR